MADHVNRYAAMGPRLTLNPGATAVRTEPLYMGSSLYQLSKRAPKFASKLPESRNTAVKQQLGHINVLTKRLVVCLSAVSSDHKIIP